MRDDPFYRGASSATRQFLQHLRARQMPDDTVQDRSVGLNAGLSYLKQSFDPRWPGLSADRAADYARYSKDATNALGASPYSIAGSQDPFKYGSVAGDEFKDMFGDSTRRNAFEDASSTLDRGFASRNQLGMARRQLGSSFTGEDNEY